MIVDYDESTYYHPACTNGVTITRTMTAGETATIIIRYTDTENSGSFTVMVGKNLDAPVITLSTDTAALGDSVTVTWEAVEGAEYYSVVANGIGSGSLTETSYTFTCNSLGQIPVHVWAHSSNQSSASSGTYYVTVGFPADLDSVAVNSETEVAVGCGETVYKRFTAPTAGTYRFYSMGDWDTYGYLYDYSTAKQLTYNDDDGENANFLISYTMEAGETVAVGVRYYNSSNSGTIHLLVSRGNEIDSTMLTMPASLTTIGANAFSNTDAHLVVIPSSVTSIDSTAFSGCEDLIIIGYSGSAA